MNIHFNDSEQSRSHDYFRVHFDKKEGFTILSLPASSITTAHLLIALEAWLTLMESELDVTDVKATRKAMLDDAIEKIARRLKDYL